MEFPDLGKHCSKEGCGQLDFLPFRCTGCGKHYCEEHARGDAHSCSAPSGQSRYVPVCPICQRPVALGKGEDPNTKVWEHIDNGCRKSDLASAKHEKKDVCAVRRCKATGGAAGLLVKCPSCARQFCLEHRLEGDHKCGDPTALKEVHGGRGGGRLGLASSPSGWVRNMHMQRSGGGGGGGRAQPIRPPQGFHNASASQYGGRSAVSGGRGGGGELKASEWQCPVCTLINPKIVKSCSACGAPAPTAPAAPGRGGARIGAGGGRGGVAERSWGGGGQGGSQQRAGNGGNNNGRGGGGNGSSAEVGRNQVQCPTCTYVQHATHTTCQMCGAALPRQQVTQQRQGGRGEQQSGNSCNVM